MKKTYLILLVILLDSCLKPKLYGPCDKDATTETRELYYSMQKLIGSGILFGHHDDTAYGVNWKFDEDSSDVKNVTGTYPAVYGWDLSKIEHGSLTDINNIPFVLQSRLVKEAYERGGINTFCWHMDNPTNAKSAWDATSRTAADIIPGGAFHETYVQYLDRAAVYLASLKGYGGEQIPILLRPFHESTGNWFWWGAKNCTPNEFKTLWRFTINYLRETKKLHNLLIVYSTADFKSEADYMQRYPGDNYVDFMGFDHYCDQNIKTYYYYLNTRLALLDIMAAKHHKPACLAETGYLNIPQADWWTKVLLPVISKHKTSYLMIWRNADSTQYYAPYPGQASAVDFKKFSESGHLIFQNRLTPLHIYGK